MELRHLRYFIAAVEEGSLKVAAEKRLHTAQPSLSRQIRDLEAEVGVLLLTRGPRGVEPTIAGRVFLDHARLAVTQVQAAVEAARQAARPTREVFSVGILVGHEADCLPAIASVFQSELPNIEVRMFSGFSTDLAEEVARGKLDVAFIRREPRVDLEFKLVMREALVVILPRAHRLASHASIDPKEFTGETFIGISRVPRVLRAAVNGYLAKSRVDIRPHLEIDNFAMAISLVETTGGLGMLPASIESFLPPSMTSRPVKGEQPVVDLVMSYRPEAKSPLFEVFLSKFEKVIERIGELSRSPVVPDPAVAGGSRGSGDHPP